jgi:hypothetical protein
LQALLFSKDNAGTQVGLDEPSSPLAIGHVSDAVPSDYSYSGIDGWGSEEVRQKHPQTLASINNLVFALRNQERYNEAQTMYRQAL